MNEMLLYVTAVMSLVSFVLMGVDKSRAKRGAWRISEKTLLTVAAMFGAPGAMAGMYYFRHKTKHKKFAVGLPAMLVVQLAVLTQLV